MMMLLHIASRATTVTTVDAFSVWLGSLALLTVIAAIIGVLWRRELRRLARRSLRGSSRLLGPALLLAAILPAVLPYDHLFVANEDAHASQAVHEEHCHGDAASCSDAPLAAAGMFLTMQPLILLPAMLTTLMFSATLMLRGRTERPELQPPLGLRLSIG